MKIADLRVQSSTPDATSSSSVLGLYVTANSGLTLLDTAGVRRGVSSTFSGTYGTGNVFTGNAINHLQTGVVIGSGALLLGSPQIFLPITVGGTGYLIPAYSYKI